MESRTTACHNAMHGAVAAAGDCFGPGVAEGWGVAAFVAGPGEPRILFGAPIQCARSAYGQAHFMYIFQRRFWKGFLVSLYFVSFFLSFWYFLSRSISFYFSFSRFLLCFFFLKLFFSVSFSSFFREHFSNM